MKLISTFPLSSGMYICQRDSDFVIVTIKGILPMLTIDGGVDLGSYFKERKLKEASKEILANIQLFPEKWKFYDTKDFVNNSVFSKNEFHPSGELTLNPDTLSDIRDKYYSMCQQGVSSTKIILSLAYEFKVSADMITNLVNRFDEEA